MVHHCLLSIGAYSAFKCTSVLWYYKKTVQKHTLKTSSKDPNEMPHLIVHPGAFESRDRTRVVWEVYNMEKGKN